MNVYICSPHPVNWKVIRKTCPTCNKRRKMLVEYYEWYDAMISCLSCGDQWSDGERLPRPFYRNWREDAVKRLKRRLEMLKNELSQFYERF